MLEQDIKKVISIMKDKKYLKNLKIKPRDIIKAIKLAQEEFKELENIIDTANDNGDNIEMLCQKLKGHNENFNVKYPDNKYFDLNYKSLLVTIIQPIDKNNQNQLIKVSKNNVYIYPDNISKCLTDEIVQLDFNEKLNLDEIIEARYINQELVEIVEIFMEENDGKALKKLYELTNDQLVKILIDWREEYSDMIDENFTYPSSMYNDVMRYVWNKYHLSEITKQEEQEEQEELEK